MSPARPRRPRGPALPDRAGWARLTRRCGIGLLLACTVALPAACSKSDTTAYCEAARENFDASELANLGTDPADVASLGKAFQTVADVAPNSVKGSWQTLATYMKDFAAADGDTEALAELDERSREVMQASAAVQSDLQKTCGFSGE